MSDKLRDQEFCGVFGHELDRTTLTPVKHMIVNTPGRDYGSDPIGDGTHCMVPSGDIVDFEERCNRLAYLSDLTPRVA